MKTYSKYILTGIIMIGLTASGCKKSFLDQTPESSIAGSNFYKTETDIKQAVNGAYSSIMDMGRISYWLFGEMRSDNTTYQNNTSDRGYEQREFIDQFLVGATAEPIQTYWQQNYTGIARCNEIIDRIGDVPMSEETRNQYQAEALFLRAFNYFNLVRQFGAVPLRLASTQAPSDALSGGRAAETEVYAQIILDLKTASEKLPVKYAASEAGRATQGAALTLLAKVHMTQKNFAEALTALRTVQTLGYGLLPRYEDVFEPANKNNIESVFEIQYLGAQPGLSSNFMYIFAPYTSGTVVTGDPGSPLGGGNGWNIPTQDMINAYEAGDVRKDISLAEGFTDATGKFVSIPYVRKYNHGFVERGRTDDNFPVLRYADVLLMIAECLNEQGFSPDGEAFTLLNQIRTRAKLPSKTASNTISSLQINSQSAFRTAILQERRIELAFENHRWYDLVRTGNAVTLMAEHGKREIATKAYIPSGSYVLSENKLLLPIPQREINLDNLTQNPQ
ncbi:RagB/SusD family nutrient uptake outer membrane protein [Pedobacter sp.]|uniref:RagB/SusD family nutrient uptake outer membrane protein n=1 Tax=Pedobacter sp. TaxID=1411316 RepID=UPI003D7F28E3